LFIKAKKAEVRKIPSHMIEIMIFMLIKEEVDQNGSGTFFLARAMLKGPLLNNQGKRVLINRDVYKSAGEYKLYISVN
jgi:hypothetical protein